MRIFNKQQQWRLAQWLEIRWWRRYLSGRPAGIYLEDKRRYWNRVLAAAGFRPVPGVCSLDAGCGPAGIFIMLNEQHVTALDPLLPAYRELPHFDPALYPFAHFIAEKLEDHYPDRLYEEVYCLNAINHVADWPAAMQRLAEVTRPGGRLLLGSDVHRSDRLRYIFRRLPGDALHPQQHNRSDYRRRLLADGWIIEREVTLKPGKLFDYVLWSARRPLP